MPVPILLSSRVPTPNSLFTTITPFDWFKVPVPLRRPIYMLPLPEVVIVPPLTFKIPVPLSRPTTTSLETVSAPVPLRV